MGGDFCVVWPEKVQYNDFRFAYLYASRMPSFSFKRQGERAFTLVELLVVVAIIGLLSTIVVVSINSARIRARDIKRVSDLRQIQLALELFSDSHNQTYPSHDIYDNVTLCAGGVDCGLAATDACGTKRCINPLPLDPAVGGSKYWYTYTQTSAAPTLFHLGANLEEAVDALGNDRDCGDGASGTCPGSPYTVGSSPIAGPNNGIINTVSPDNSNGCQNVAGTNRYCYDLTN